VTSKGADFKRTSLCWEGVANAAHLIRQESHLVLCDMAWIGAKYPRERQSVVSPIDR